MIHSFLGGPPMVWVDFAPHAVRFYFLIEYVSEAVGHRGMGGSVRAASLLAEGILFTHVNHPWDLLQHKVVVLL
jgi:hypothetical protein